MRTKATDAIELFSLELDRCPLAILRDLRPQDRIELDTFTRLAIAKRTDSLSPYPGDYTNRSLCLIDTAESELIKMEMQRAKEAAAEQKTKPRPRYG